MEIHFPHITNGIHTTKCKRRVIAPRRLITAAVPAALCSLAVIFLVACNVGGGGY